MGQSAASGNSRGSGGLIFSNEEVKVLRDTLDVGEDVPEATVSLSAFLARFPLHLRPLVQPLFFRLAREPTGRDGARWWQRSGGGPPAGSPTSMMKSEEEVSAPWPLLLAGLSECMREGLNWNILLEAWVGNEDLSRCEVDKKFLAATHLAASLCFWCGNPNQSPGPGLPGGVTASAVSLLLAGPVIDPLETVISALCRDDVRSHAGAKQRAIEVLNRLESAAPCLPMAVGPRLAQALLKQPSIEPPLAASRILDRGLAFLLRGTSRALYEGSWELAYTDWPDGGSLSRLSKNLANHRGVAVVLVRACSAESEVLGAVIDGLQDTAGGVTGNTGSYLIALWPTLETFRCTGKGKQFAYLNSTNKKQPRGMGFGGDHTGFRMWFSPELTQVQVSQTDLTYVTGPLLPHTSSCTISRMEVWVVSPPSPQPRM
eukprot:CAMPEP_0206423356 /NCGR_PEP_ID=MMETSP0324_2-20121206/2636_1 /ASSEMBLY_ACC=CAM_ASM_000836 /TAXON_ID=2866 /ORGANISM="Crypthecodinium cohnii, Strain Seligo" /LENGTH=429 /DNA_ID=CAMNT_0053887909 /DNA_START=10 /DNA_END=1296 /DNA_ORIENTATION=+